APRGAPGRSSPRCRTSGPPCSTAAVRSCAAAPSRTGPGGGLILAVLSGPADAATLTVERVDAAGKRLGVLYRSTAYGTVGLPASVTLTPDSTRHYLLLTYNSRTVSSAAGSTTENSGSCRMSTLSPDCRSRPGKGRSRR